MLRFVMYFSLSTLSFLLLPYSCSTHPSCVAYHFRISDFCDVHAVDNHDAIPMPKPVTNAHNAALAASAELGVPVAPPVLTSVEKAHVAFDNLTQLRHETQNLSESFKVDGRMLEYIPMAREILAGTHASVKDIEIAQFLHQFKRMDVNADGIIDNEDIRSLVAKIDPEFLASEGEIIDKLTSWIRNSTEPETDTLTFSQYVSAVLRMRRLESRKNASVELLRTGFFDLRSAVLYAPDQPLEGWMLKRGNLIPKEGLNAWYRRYFKLKGFLLEYYDTKPLAEGETAPLNSKGEPIVAVLMGSVDLHIVALCDFSPKTTVTKQRNLLEAGVNPETQVVFKLTLFNGRRYTLAASREAAIDWVSKLQWYAFSSRQIIEFKENWGTKRKEVITLRDWCVVYLTNYLPN